MYKIQVDKCFFHDINSPTNTVREKKVFFLGQWGNYLLYVPIFCLLPPTFLFLKQSKDICNANVTFCDTCQQKAKSRSSVGNFLANLGQK